MKKSLAFFLVIGLLIAFAAGNSSAQQIKVDRWVMGSGGMINSGNSAGWHLSGILGQIAIEKRVGTYQSKPMDIYQGFWVPVGETTPVGPGPVVYNNALSNFPNPVTTTTNIHLELPGTCQVTINVYDVIGNLVRVLVSNEIQEAGEHNILWDVKNQAGVDLGSGSYLYELVVQPAQMAGSSGFQAYSLRNVMVVVK